MNLSLQIGLFIALVGTAGCATTLDSQSGGDQNRAQAIEIDLNQDTHDSISATAGDHTDWKKFIIPMDTSVTVIFFWDSPYSEITISIRDQAGRRLYRLRKTKGQEQNQWRGLRLREGMHYLEIRAHTLGSVYTLKIVPDDGV